MTKEQVIEAIPITESLGNGRLRQLVRTKIKCPLGEHLVSELFDMGRYENELLKKEEVWKCAAHAA
jgi:hypothetical protein